MVGSIVPCRSLWDEELHSLKLLASPQLFAAMVTSPGGPRKKGKSPNEMTLGLYVHSYVQVMTFSRLDWSDASKISHILSRYKTTQNVRLLTVGSDQKEHFRACSPWGSRRKTQGGKWGWVFFNEEMSKDKLLSAFWVEKHLVSYFYCYSLGYMIELEVPLAKGYCPTPRGSFSKLCLRTSFCSFTMCGAWQEDTEWRCVWLFEQNLVSRGLKGHFLHMNKASAEFSRFEGPT